MSEPRESPESMDTLPQATTRRSKWHFSIVWLVPLIAAIAATTLVYEHLRAWGPEITIAFDDASGVRADQTPVNYRGVAVGKVTAVELSEDSRHALVYVRLRRSAAALARQGARFWIVRPRVGLENVTGLGTVLTGPEVQALPGSGRPQTRFTGLEVPPTLKAPGGLRIVLRASQAGSLRPDAPVYYRGVQVGSVRDIGLTRDSTAVDIEVVVDKRYRTLVRDDSKFWIVGGADITGGLLRGLEVKVESLRSLLVTGIAFATPENGRSKPAHDGSGYLLYEEPSKEWLHWAPRIKLPREQ